MNRAGGDYLGSLTVSIGAAQYVYGEALEGWIDWVDKALYAAKTQGRDTDLFERDIA